MKRKNTQKIVSVCAAALIAFSQSVPAYAQAINKNPDPVADLIRSLLADDEAKSALPEEQETSGDQEISEEQEIPEEQETQEEQEPTEETESFTEEVQVNEPVEEIVVEEQDPTIEKEEQATSSIPTQEADGIITGTWGTSDWTFDESTGFITFHEGSLEYYDKSPWRTVLSVKSIKKIIFDGIVYAHQDMDSAFAGLTELESIVNLENLEMRRILTAVAMFSECSSLTSLDLSGVDTSKLTYMSYMFNGCTSLTSLDLSGFDKSNVKSMNNLFRGCTSLKNLNLSNFDTKNALDMNNMFKDASSLTNLDVSGFDTSQVEYMNGMFSGAKGLTSLDVSNFDTSQVVDMSSMFSGTTGLKSLDVSKFDTGQVTRMNEMFSGVTGLTSLDVSNFDTSQVTDMSSMFLGTTGLKSLDVSNFDTSQVTDMSEMFSGTTGLKSLDVSNFDTKNVEKMTSMFQDVSVSKLSLGDKFTFLSDAALGAPVMEEGGTTGNWIREDGQSKGYSPTDFMANYGKEELKAGDYVAEEDTLIRGKWGTSPWTFDEATGVVTIEPGTLWMYDTSPWNRVGSNNVPRDKVKKIIFQGPTVLSSYSKYLFSDRTDGGLKNLVEIQGMEHLDTTGVGDMRGMFKGASSLEKLDLSSFSTESVSNMSNMFNGASSLKELNLSSFDTSRVTSMGNMFQGVSSLEELDLSSFDTSKITTMSYMFNGASSLKKLDLSSFDTSKVTRMELMFNGVSSLEKLDLSSFDTSQVTTMEQMFSNTSSLVELDLSSFNTSKVTNMALMFAGNKSLVKLDVSSFDTSQVTTMSDMFKNCESLLELDLSNFDTSQVTNMYQMFWGSKSLVKLDLSSFNTSKVNTVNRMFSGCRSLEELDLSSFDTTTITTPNMFTNVPLKRLILGNNFRFTSDAKLRKPSPSDDRPVTGNWIREDGQSKGYSPTDFMEKYGQGDLTAGAYIAEVVPQANLELRVDFNKESGKAIVGDEVGTTMTIKHSKGSEVGSVATDMSVEAASIYSDKAVSIDKLDSEGAVIETSEQVLTDGKILLDQLNYGESYVLHFEGTAWNNIPKLNNWVYTAALSYFDGYDSMYTRKIGNYEVKSGPFGFTKVPEALKFKETKLTSQLKEEFVDREEIDWQVSLQDYRGTNSLTPPEEAPVVDRVDWEMTATAQGFQDSKGNVLPEGTLGVVFQKNGVPSELSLEEQVIESHSVKDETPKEHNKLDLSWEEAEGFKAIVHNRNGLKTGENYQAQVDFELRIAP